MWHHRALNHLKTMLNSAGPIPYATGYGPIQQFHPDRYTPAVHSIKTDALNGAGVTCGVARSSVPFIFNATQSVVLQSVNGAGSINKGQGPNTLIIPGINDGSKN